jgi:hypothetical protein
MVERKIAPTNYLISPLSSLQKVKWILGAIAPFRNNAGMLENGAI